MRLEQIQYFLMIVQCGSITKAAESLYISQPALSKQLALLEDEIGVRLFSRHARGIQLTEAGEQFASDCIRIRNELEEAVRRAASFGKAKPIQLRVGCFDGAVTDDFLPDLQKRFKQKEPELQLKLSRNRFSENRMALDAGRIDMMIELARKGRDGLLQTISGLSEKERDYRISVLVQRPSAVIYSIYSPLAEKNELTASDIVEEPYLMGKSKEEKWLAEPALEYLSKESGKKPRIEIVDNFMSLMSNIELGNGYCNLARSIVDKREDLMAWGLPEELGVSVAAVWKSGDLLVDRLMGK